jgi:MFS family permease
MSKRALWLLYGSNLITASGMWFFLPLLPIFIGRRGGSAALVGAVFAAGLLANAAIRYPAGWAADRFGTRVVMVVAMAAYAALFLAYLLPLPLPLFVVVRFFHGAAAGAFWPAANGLIAEATAPKERSHAYGMMQSTNMAGMLLGPAVGGFVALFDFNATFVMSAITCGVAAIALGLIPAAHVRAEEAPPPPERALRIARSLLPLLVFGTGTAYVIGTFDTIWPLYMTDRGASTFWVGVSFTAFALPAMLFSTQAGVLGDRFGPRRVIVATLLGAGFFAALYPFITSFWWLIGLGLVEGAVTITGSPVLNAEVSHAAPPGQQGRTQGLYQTVMTLVQIAGALGGGALFALSPTYAFLAMTAVCMISAGAGYIPKPARRRTVSEAAS